MGGCSSKPSAAPAVPAAPAAPSKPSAGKYVIVGASGYIGKATVGALVAAVGGGNVIVATRNPTSPAGAEFTVQGATVVAGDLNNKASLIPVFAGAKAVYIITPGAENRTELATNGINAAKEAGGVGFLLVLSVANAYTDTIFGRQFGPIEDATRASGLPYTIIRLPLFTDNIFGQAGPIKGAGQFYGPADPTKKFTSITVDEAARSAVAILTNKTTGPFQGILGDTLDLTGPAYTHEELAAALTASLGKPVTYVQVPYDAALTSFVSSGWPEWQAKGVLELYRSVDAGTYLYKTDLPKTIGTKGKTVVEYIEAVKGGLA